MSIQSNYEPSQAVFALGTAWTNRQRQSSESRLDCETSVTLRCHLSGDFAEAESWSDLVTRLATKGFHLTFDHDRLILVNQYNGIDICTCRYLGYSFASLARVFGKPCVVTTTGRVITSPKYA